MGIFSSNPSDNEINKMFSDLLIQAEQVLFREFKSGYKNGYKDPVTPDINGIKRWRLKTNSIAFESPKLLGVITGYCVRLLINPATYESNEISGILEEMLSFLFSVPGFNRNVLKKRVNILDVKKLSQHGVSNLKTILSIFRQL